MTVDHLRAALEIKQVSEQRIISGHAAAWALDRVGDVIEPTAFAKTLREKQPSDVAVFIGHKADELPVGVPLRIEADGHGLYTEVKVFDGPRGDDLLAAARGLLAVGQTLGLSIGYRVRDSRTERVDGKTVRRLTDIDLIEFSYAARQTIANPAALVVGVKQTDDDQDDEAKAAVGSFEWTRQRVQRALREQHERGCYVIEIFPTRVVYRVFGMEPDEVEQFYQATYSVNGDTVTLGKPELVDVQYVPSPANPNNKQASGGAMPYEIRKNDAGKFCVFNKDTGRNTGCSDTEAMAKRHLAALYAAESGAQMGKTDPRDLPDSAYLYVEPGDQEDGRTVQSKRHFVYRDAEGAIDPTALAEAVGAIPTSAVLDEPGRRALSARARRMLMRAEAGKTVDDPAAFKAGAAGRVLALGYRLCDLAEQIADEQAALVKLGEDTREGGRVRAALRAELHTLSEQLAGVAGWADTIEAGKDAEALVNRYRRELELLEVG